MNKKAFTLVELIVIIIIIGVILIFALPNTTSTIERKKKEAMINDARDFIEKTKIYAQAQNQYPTSTPKTFRLRDIDVKYEIVKSPYGDNYDREASGVKVELIHDADGYRYEFTVTLKCNSHIINEKQIADLLGKNKYEYVERRAWV